MLHNIRYSKSLLLLVTLATSVFFNQAIVAVAAGVSNTAVTSVKRQALHPIAGKPKAPDFSLLDIDGNRHSLKSYAGKVILLNFWATWCPPCREELPSMERVYLKLKSDGVVLLAINIGEDSDTIFTFTADYPVSFPLLIDRDSSVIKSYPVVGLPTTIIIDRQGRMVYRAVGSREWDNPQIVKVLKLLN